MDENSVIIDIYSDKTVEESYNNCLTFGGSEELFCLESYDLVNNGLNPYSFEKLLCSFTADEINSIHMFCLHHKISVQEAVKYKVLCHYCGKKLSEFGTQLCSIRCSMNFLKGTKSCAFGSNCKFCRGKSIFCLSKQTGNEATKLTEKLFLDHPSLSSFP